MGSRLRAVYPQLPPLLALPITVGTAKYPGIKIHDTRMIRLMEVLLHGGTVVSGWTTRQTHDAILTSFRIGADRYGLNQLRYDLRKLKAHGLLARDGKRYAHRLTEKGTKVALLFILFHKQLCGPLANSLFHHQPAPCPTPEKQARNRIPQSQSLYPEHPSIAPSGMTNVEVFLFTNEKVRI